MAKKAVTKEKEISKGVCSFGSGEFEKGKMTQHLKYCKQRIASLETPNSPEVEKTKLFHLVVEGRYLPMYWMHLEMPADATLLDLDYFLRDTWLECCDHLSAFRIGKVSYSSQMEDASWEFADPNSLSEEETSAEKEDEEVEGEDANLSPMEVIEQLLEVLSAEFQGDLADDPLPELETKLSEILTSRLGISLPPEMRSQVSNLANYLQLSSSLLSDSYREQDIGVELGKVLKVGQKFTHEYDFGSTTELALRVVSEREGIETKDEDGDPLPCKLWQGTNRPLFPVAPVASPPPK